MAKNYKQISTTQRKVSDFLVQKQQELMNFLIENLASKSRNTIKIMLKEKQILVDGMAISQFNHMLVVGNRVHVELSKPPEKIKYHGLKIIFEDEHLIIIDKKEGMLSIATDKNKDQTAYSILSEHVKRYDFRNKIYVIHRLDRETSGIMMFAKNQQVQKQVQETWGPTTKERTYVAVVQGLMEHPTGSYSSYLVESKAMIVHSSQNKNFGVFAQTHYETIKANKYFTLLKLNLETGRKNQIRVHMQDIGHPIIGDEKYGATKNPIGRLGLHALSLAFEHPVTKELLKFESPIPVSFTNLIK